MYKEKEVRIQIDDIKEFRKKLKKIGAVNTVKYSCVDYVCEPKHKHWDPHFVNLKIRRQLTGDRKGIIELSFHKVKWINKIKVTVLGFKAILEIPNARIADFISLMNWRILVKYSRHGWHYTLNGYDFTIEKIQHVGYLIEVETETLNSLNKIIKLIGEEDNIIKKAVPEIVLENIK